MNHTQHWSPGARLRNRLAGEACAQGRSAGFETSGIAGLPACANRQKLRDPIESVRVFDPAELRASVRARRLLRLLSEYARERELADRRMRFDAFRE
ncbi:hypothetical protein ASA1KI_16450 [Opitutales bacterium ASA1]|uniref:hypothetical protein n=1 Tax=Congregicoccus parvus TaxID=3081749 RepID=UPI002B2BD712|nr:hypothetical protein ASA1KI_16450 [Opitutales bacterium ASA1]